MTYHWHLYDVLSVKKPISVLLVLVAVVTATLTQVDKFRLDASADALLLEGDPDLKYFRDVVERYGAQDFLAIAVTPRDGGLFDRDNIDELSLMQGSLERIAGVKGVLSMLNAPLFRSPPVPLSRLAEGTRTLLSPETDTELAERELIKSPIYRDLLVSRNARSAMLLVNYAPDKRYDNLLRERERLRGLRAAGEATPEDLLKLEHVTADFSSYRVTYLEKNRVRIETVRSTMQQHTERFDMFLGGAPMIVNDMIAFIQKDLTVFSGAVLLFLILTLTFLFRDLRWVAVAILSALLPAASMFGLLGMLDKEVTVISSNFASLLLIIVMSMTIHIIVRHREMQLAGDDHFVTIQDTMRYMFKPCVYTSLTTIAAFASLLVSGIRPVIDFGHVMSLGIVFAFLFVFMFLPNAIRLTHPRPPTQLKPPVGHALTDKLAHVATEHRLVVIFIAVAVAMFSALGAARLDVENRFIDYFDEETEVHQGMLKIDNELGGTTPFDLVVTAPKQGSAETSAETQAMAMGETEAPDVSPTDVTPGDALDDPLLGDLLGDDYTADTGETAPVLYWLNSHRVARLKEIHDALESLDSSGKVLSPVTLIRMLEIVNGGPLSDLDLAFIPRMLPAEASDTLLHPFLAKDGSEVRFSTRIIDSDPELKRKDFLKEVEQSVAPHVRPDESARVTGVLVLYNNMLQSLFSSQILTLAAVLIAIMLMFVVLFRSVSLAVIGIIPSALAASLILGMMGWLGIPLDLMTITIAAITIGIAVDNTIHYIVRFKREYSRTHDALDAVHRCHGTIGRAVYYTSTIIVVGFSILTLSNFTPTQYFGVLTGIAMLAAFFATLTLLPALLLFAYTMHTTHKRV